MDVVRSFFISPIIIRCNGVFTKNKQYSGRRARRHNFHRRSNIKTSCTRLSALIPPTAVSENKSVRYRRKMCIRPNEAKRFSCARCFIRKRTRCVVVVVVAARHAKHSNSQTNWSGSTAMSTAVFVLAIRKSINNIFYTLLGFDSHSK